MYNKFFGFKEKPFKLVPNPEYLFLSKSHEEALAHLTYAISHGDGFVEVTGEVGTGKTTLCRVFLENLDKGIEAAYIFNPKLDALQLLKAINDEFGIDSAPDNTKDLIDRLNEFLIEKKRAGQKVLVLIDEAQNLSLEVLEQLRLLSNLETTRDKLLQTILVGQPELGEMLASHQLRQLGQRITINCHLEPLTFQETKDYIRHRISLASHRAGPPFDKAAYRLIYEYSKGIPRLINIACDRALLNGFGRNSFKITGAIAKEAIRELKREKTGSSHGLLPGRSGPAILAGAVIVPLAVLLFYLYNAHSPVLPPAGETVISVGRTEGAAVGTGPILSEHQETDAEEHEGTAAEPETAGDALQASAESAGPAASANETAAAEETGLNSRNENNPEQPQDKPESYAEKHLAGNKVISPEESPVIEDGAEKFFNLLKGLNARHSRNSSMEGILKSWYPEKEAFDLRDRIESDPAFFEQTAKNYGLQVQPIATDGDFTLIRNLNLPAIFTFYLPGHLWPKYLAVLHVDNETIYILSAEQQNLVPIDRSAFMQYWSGEAYISWNDFKSLSEIITVSSSRYDVGTLKELLRQLGYAQISQDGKYDEATVGIIKHIQEKYGLHVDGVVGPFTKIALYNESAEFVKPSLDRLETFEPENGS